MEIATLTRSTKAYRIQIPLEHDEAFVTFVMEKLKAERVVRTERRLEISDTLRQTMAKLDREE